MSEKIKFGTDGWRAIIAQDFTVENVARVADATGKWLLNQGVEPKITIGHDCRFAGELFMETAAKVFLSQGIKVYMNRGFISTPMLSLGTKNYGCRIGVILTASHNPPSYNGYKIKADFGGPLQPEYIQEIIWNVIKSMLSCEPQILVNRHLDQLVMCAIYSVCKISDFK